jgi:hypothetical protein
MPVAQRRDALSLLLRVGSRTVRIKPVAIDHTTLNAGDVFVLDAGLSIYLWNGSGASHKEKAKGLEVALAIKDDERGGRAKLTACDQGGRLRHLRKMSSDFANPGSKPGLEIWRIESLAAVPLPAKDFGTFYDGDSYLVLKTTETTGGKYVYDLFFWLGSESSQDEQGAAAYKAVELDDLLGGAPVQVRLGP